MHIRGSALPSDGAQSSKAQAARKDTAYPPTLPILRARRDKRPGVRPCNGPIRRHRNPPPSTGMANLTIISALCCGSSFPLPPSARGRPIFWLMGRSDGLPWVRPFCSMASPHGRGAAPRVPPSKSGIPNDPCFGNIVNFPPESRKTLRQI